MDEKNPNPPKTKEKETKEEESLHLGVKMIPPYYLQENCDRNVLDTYEDSVFT